MKTMFIITILLISISACNSQINLANIQNIKPNNDSIEIININKILKEEKFELAPIIEEIKLVKLETTAESILKDYGDILVTNDYIYITDNYKGQGLSIFQRNGQFVKRVPNGLGPGELYSNFEIAYNYEKNELVVSQSPSKIFFYTPEGAFKSEIDINISIASFISHNNEYFAYIEPGVIGKDLLKKFKNNIFFVLDSNFTILKTAISEKRQVPYYDSPYITKADDKIYFTHQLCDTIYQYSEKLLQVKYVFIYDDKLQINPKQLDYRNVDFFIETLIRNSDKYWFGGGYFTNKNNHVFLLNKVTSSYSIYQDKKTKHLIGGLIPQINSQPIYALSKVLSSYNDYYIYVLQSSENNDIKNLIESNMIDEIEKKKLLENNEEDNPILIFVKYKPF